MKILRYLFIVPLLLLIFVPVAFIMGLGEMCKYNKGINRAIFEWAETGSWKESNEK